MNFVDIYQKYWKNGYTLTDRSLSGIDREVFRSLFNPVAEVFRKYPAGDVHLYIPGVGQVSGLQPGNYFDSAGTTLASVDGSVGLVLDAAGSVGANLCPPLAAGQGWNTGTQTTLSTGSVSVASSAYTQPFLYKGILTVGKMYEVTYTISSITTGGIYSFVGSGATGPTRTATGTYTERTVCAGNTNGGLACTTGTTATITDVIYKEVTGTHATQATPGYKPTLRKGIVNLLKYAQDFSQWNSFGGTGLTNGLLAPDGSMTAVQYQTNKTVGGYYSNPETGSVIAATYTSAGYVRRISGASNLTFVCRGQWAFGGTGGDRTVVFDGTTGTFVSKSAEISSYSIADAGNGFWLVTGTYAPTAATSAPVAFYGTESGQTIQAWRAGLFAGTLTAQQIIAAGGIPLTTTAPASSSAGNAYWEFDGVDDRLSLPALGITDTCTFVFAITPRAFDTRVIFSSDTGGPQLYLTTGGWLTFDKVGTGTLSSLNAGLQLDTPVVLSVRLSEGVVTIRKNGVLIGTTPSVLTFTSTVNHAIGAQTAGAFAYKGLLHQFEPLRFAANDADLLVLEKFIGSLSGVAL